MQEKKIRSKRALAFVLMFAVLLTQFMPLSGHNHTAYAAQQNSYHDLPVTAQMNWTPTP